VLGGAGVSTGRLLFALAATTIGLGVVLDTATSGAAPVPHTVAPVSAPAVAPASGKPPAAPLPPWYSDYVDAAAGCPGLDPLVLVAIHDVETARDSVGSASHAGAIGPMQFMADTWAKYGVDADGDGVANPWDLHDALASATDLLCANGITDPSTYGSALWNYNHSLQYVSAVIDRTIALHDQLTLH